MFFIDKFSLLTFIFFIFQCHFRRADGRKPCFYTPRVLPTQLKIYICMSSCLWHRDKKSWKSEKKALHFFGGFGPDFSKIFPISHTFSSWISKWFSSERPAIGRLKEKIGRSCHTLSALAVCSGFIVHFEWTTLSSLLLLCELQLPKKSII